MIYDDWKGAWIIIAETLHAVPYLHQDGQPKAQALDQAVSKKWGGSAGLPSPYPQHKGRPCAARRLIGAPGPLPVPKATRLFSGARPIA